MSENLVDILETLSKKQKAVLFWCIKRQAHESLRKQFHLGLMPLIKRSTALECVVAEAAGGNKTRLVRELIGRLTTTNHVTFRMYLDDARMIRLFGGTMEKGRRLSGSMRKNIVEFQGDDRRKVTLDPTVTAKWISKGLWKITCAAEQYEYANSWLLRLASPDRIPMKLK